VASFLDELFGLHGKTAVVTGGSRGIGNYIARGLLGAGVARLYICSRKEDELREAEAKLNELGQGEVRAFPADLSSLAGVEAFAGEVAEREKALHILVNNAGAAWGAAVEEFPEAGWDKVVDTNLKGVFFLTQKLLPLLKAAGTAEDPARVINIGSIDGLSIPLTENFPYSASKAGVHMLTRHLGHVLARDNINVNAIAPGLFQSRMTRWFFDSGEAGDLVQGIPRKRGGSFEDAAGAAIYLASRAGAWLTGDVLVVSGGSATVT
jgi:NAD(P)-dependent dehydrogenase (short-subunit alcohol dehydrogenase family)